MSSRHVTELRRLAATHPVIAGLVPADAGRVLWRGNSPPLSQRRELMFYLPDGLRPWEDEYVARLLEFFAAAYGRPARITAEAREHLPAERIERVTANTR